MSARAQAVAQVATQPAPDRQSYYRQIDPLNLAPLWEAYGQMITREPVQQCVPHAWHYADVRGHLLESAAIISAQEAERRVLMLENPGMRGQRCITQSLFAGLQLVMPGEIAPCHRHTQTALRLVIEGHQAYTGVDGERIPMEPGDFIITPAWAWHDHGNPSPDPVVWMDGLDIPMVRFFGGSFVERYETEVHPETRPSGETQAAYGANLRPIASRVAGDGPAARKFPLWHYPYARSREALEQLRKTGEWHPSHGLKMEYINPTDGGAAMPTISTFLQLLPKGFDGAPYRSTDGTVFCALEGHGTTEIAGETFAWGPHDIFVVPSWHPYRHRASEDAVLFSYSDRVVHEKLGLWRERAG
jgi:gentisate 1,2-dioxygenase